MDVRLKGRYDYAPQGSGFPADEHFSLIEHNKIQDMRVAVVRQVQDGTAVRRARSKESKEMRLIFLLGALVPKVLNNGFEVN